MPPTSHTNQPLEQQKRQQPMNHPKIVQKTQQIKHQHGVQSNSTLKTNHLSVNQSSNSKPQQSTRPAPIRPATTSPHPPTPSLPSLPFYLPLIYQPIALLGRGCYATVVSAHYQPAQTKVAVKMVSPVFENMGDAKRILRQIKILKFLQHRNVIGVIDMGVGTTKSSERSKHQSPPITERQDDIPQPPTQINSKDSNSSLNSSSPESLTQSKSIDQSSAQQVIENPCTNNKQTWRRVKPDDTKSPTKESFSSIYIALELMDFSLRQLLENPRPIEPNVIKYIMFQLLHGIYYMHSAGIMHRDLKPENLLLNTSSRLKITDMNLAKKLDTACLTGYVTSRLYRAPQLTLGCNNYDFSIDMWSIGCILFELIGRIVLFHAKDLKLQIKRLVAILGKPSAEFYQFQQEGVSEIVKAIIRDIPDRQRIDFKTLIPNADPNAIQLLHHLLIYDPQLRFTAKECLDHAYFQQYRHITLQKCERIFDFSFDGVERNEAAIRQIIWRQVEYFEGEASKRRKTS